MVEVTRYHVRLPEHYDDAALSSDGKWLVCMQTMGDMKKWAWIVKHPRDDTMIYARKENEALHRPVPSSFWTDIDSRLVWFKHTPLCFVGLAADRRRVWLVDAQTAGVPQFATRSLDTEYPLDYIEVLEDERALCGLALDETSNRYTVHTWDVTLEGEFVPRASLEIEHAFEGKTSWPRQRVETRYCGRGVLTLQDPSAGCTVALRILPRMSRPVTLALDPEQKREYTQDPRVALLGKIKLPEIERVLCADFIVRRYDRNKHWSEADSYELWSLETGSLGPVDRKVADRYQDGLLWTNTFIEGRETRYASLPLQDTRHIVARGFSYPKRSGIIWQLNEGGILLTSIYPAKKRVLQRCCVEFLVMGLAILLFLEITSRLFACE